MFRIQNIASGEFFVMGDSSLPVDLQSSFFNKQDEFLGDKSFPAKIPLEPNRRLIKNAHLINSDNAARTLQVMTWFDDMPFKEAKMIFLIDNAEIDLTLYMNSSVIAAQLKTKKLPDLSQVGVDGQLNFATSAEFKAYLNSTTTAAPGTMPMWFFPYKNEQAYKPIDPDNYGLYPDITFPVNPYVNAWKIATHGGAGEFAVNDDPANQSQTNTPFFSVAYVTRRILQYFGYTPAGKWLDSEIANRTCIFSNIACTTANIADYVFYMPNITPANYLKELRTQFGLLIAFDQTSMICTIQNLPFMRGNSKVIDLRNKQLANSYREIGDSPTAFIITQDIDDKDSAFTESEEMPILNIGDVSGAINIENIALISAATKMITENAPVGSTASTWRIPNIKMPVYPVTPFDQISEVKTVDRANFKLRFLYYHGMVASGADLYPYGSSDNLDKDNHKLTDFTLALTIAGSTYSSMQDYYTYIKNSKPFEQGFLLRRQDLMELTPDCRILVKDFDESTVVCFYDVISGDWGKSREILSLITLYPDIQPDNKSQILPVDGMPVDPIIPPVDNGAVYIRLIFRNIKNVEHAYPAPRYQTINYDVVAQFFSDAAGTIPKDVVSLDVRLEIAKHDPIGSDPHITESIINCTSTGGEKILAANADQFNNQGGTSRNWEYYLEVSAHYTIIA